MKNVTLYVKSLLQGILTLAVYFTTMYLSTIFFLVSIFEEMYTGAENKARRERMDYLVDKIQKYAEPETQKGLQVDESLS
ncbi:MAG: hypothetical protein ACK4ND_04580 [Cytophagaceae bacterium]